MVIVENIEQQKLYCAKKLSDQPQVWEKLEQFSFNIHGPWMCFGDCNQVL